jgi:hypothetical protein
MLHLSCRDKWELIERFERLLSRRVATHDFRVTL